MTKRKKLQVLILEDTAKKDWVAHCLNYAIFAQAESLEELWDEFELMIAAHIDHALLLKMKPFSEECTVSPELRQFYDDGDPREWRSVRLNPPNFNSITIEYAPVVKRLGT